MSVVMQSGGIIDFCSAAVRDVSRADAYFEVRLFKSDTTPTRTSLLTDFTEADYAGYARQTLLRSAWGIPALAGSEAKSIYGTQPLQFGATSGTQKIYGYLVVRKSDAVLLWADRFKTSFTVSATAKLLFKPAITQRSIFG